MIVPAGFSAPAPKKKLHRAEYIQPPEFKARNGKLVETISNLVGGGKSDKFDQFKKISSSFRSGQISCEDYHRNCLELVGQKKFFEFFPELVYLLPDIKKQQVKRKHFCNI